MEIYDSEFLALNFFIDAQMMEMIWTKKSSNMRKENYKTEFLNYLSLAQRLKPKKLLVDSQASSFVVVPDLQSWTNEHIFLPSIKIGLQDVAFVLSKNIDIFSLVSLEQTMAESNAQFFNCKYFHNKQDAFAWFQANSSLKEKTRFIIDK